MLHVVMGTLGLQGRCYIGGLHHSNDSLPSPSRDWNVHCLTVEPVLKDQPIGHKNVVSQDRWSFVTGSVVLKSRTFCLDFGLSRQVVCYRSGLSRQVTLYFKVTLGIT